MPINKMPGPDNKLVVALAYDGLCTFEFGVAVEAFGLHRPEMGDGWYRFAVASVDGGELRAAGGVRMLADGGLDLIEQAGTIIAPGWRGADAAVPQALSEALRRAVDRGARVLSICSGVFVLAAAGLLAGRKATTHWRYVDTLAARYPDIKVEPDVLYVDGGNVLTSAGSAAGIDLCLHLIRRDYGPQAANSVARRLVVPPHRDGGQAQFVERAVPVSHESGRIGPLLDRMRGNIGEDWPVDRLATSAGMSRRTFLRRFDAATGTTPARWLQAERVQQARDLLETTTIGMDEIAHRLGFGSPANFRLHFTRSTGLTPSIYRQRFARR